MPLVGTGARQRAQRKAENLLRKKIIGCFVFLGELCGKKI